MKRVLALALVLMMALPLAACGSSKESDETGSVYYLNFKPEADQQWQDLAKLYTEKTGVEVTVLTAASGDYETTLKSEIAKSEAPTMFQVNGAIGLASWKDYCYDMSGSEIMGQLASEDFALKNGNEVAGIGYAIESYGIIYNKKLLDKAGYKEEDIKSFADLKKEGEDITKRSDELGFSAFTSSGMDGSSDWRFKTHLANMPLYYEFQEDGLTSPDTIKGSYLDNYRAIWDLYINNATCSPTQISTKTSTDAIADFVTEKAVFYQNGTWAITDLAEMDPENLGMLPIYIGVEGEEKQGLCTGCENYWCVNKNASEADIKATLDFMNWCVTSDEGLKALCDDMGFVTPFKGNKNSTNPLVNCANEWVQKGNFPVTWAFTCIPSENWKDGVGSALTSYAADQTDANWNNVVKAFVDGWATEKAATK